MVGTHSKEVLVHYLPKLWMVIDDFPPPFAYQRSTDYLDRIFHKAKYQRDHLLRKEREHVHFTLEWYVDEKAIDHLKKRTLDLYNQTLEIDGIVVSI